MAKAENQKGQDQVEAGDPASGEQLEIEASGDAIVIAGAINNLAEAFGELSASIRAMLPAPVDDIDEDAPRRYLDGTPIKG